MEELVAQLKVILANTVTMYYKSHVIHWNVIGADFPQYHDFFGDVYEDLFEAIDPVAEHIRFLGEKVPASLTALQGVASVTDTIDDDADFESMLTDLQAANDATIAALREGITTADTAGEPAVGNFLQDRLGAHQKLAWKFRSLLA